MKNKIINIVLIILLITSIGFLIYQQVEIKNSLSQIKEQAELIDILESEKEKLETEKQEIQDKIDTLNNEKNKLESEKKDLEAEKKDLEKKNKSLEQSKVEIETEEVTENTKDVAKSNNLQATENTSGTTGNSKVDDFFSNSGNAFDGVTFGGQATTADSGYTGNVELQ